MQSALIELLRGNIWQSILLYPALMPLVFMFVFLVLHLIFRFERGALVLKFTFFFNVLLIIFPYLYKYCNQ